MCSPTTCVTLPSPITPPTWAALVAIEPDLAILEADARAFRPTRSYGRYDFWSVYVKPCLSELVGWSAQNPTLRTSCAYNVARVRVCGLLRL